MIKEHRLPCCGYVVNEATVIYSPDTQAAPKPDDITMCLNCGAVLVFTSSDGETRKARASDLMVLSEEQRDQLRWAGRYIKERGKIH